MKNEQTCFYIKPEDFLFNKAATKLETKESKEFMQKIVKEITDLKEQGIEDSIVLGFNVYMESVKMRKKVSCQIIFDNCHTMGLTK